jgi:hypothetical protein
MLKTLYFVHFPLLLNVNSDDEVPGYITAYFMNINFVRQPVYGFRHSNLGKGFGNGRTSLILQMKKFKTSENEQSHGSFFLRVGGLGKAI